MDGSRSNTPSRTRSNTPSRNCWKTSFGSCPPRTPTWNSSGSRVRHGNANRREPKPPIPPTMKTINNRWAKLFRCIDGAGDWEAHPARALLPSPRSPAPVIPPLILPRYLAWFSRLRRPMCGRSSTFRELRAYFMGLRPSRFDVVNHRTTTRRRQDGLRLNANRWGIAQNERRTFGRSKTFRTSGGKAAKEVRGVTISLITFVLIQLHQPENFDLCN